MSTFTEPAPPGEGIQWEKHKGALLLVEPLELEEAVKTVHGEKDAVSANVSVIDGPGAGESYEECLIFPAVLVTQTKRKIGAKVLGRLGQGNKKPGQNAPWMLEKASESDVALAEAWLTRAKPIESADPPF